MKSPIEKTLCSGQFAGVAKTSPRNWSFGFSSTRELMNSPSAARWSRTDAAADGAVGMTPPLAAIAMKFESPPSAMIGTPAMRRFANANAPSST